MQFHIRLALYIIFFNMNSKFFSLFLFIFFKKSSSQSTIFDDYRADVDPDFNDDNLGEKYPGIEIPVIDHLREDDHEDFELADIIALSLSMVDHDIDLYTDEQRQEMVDTHNAYRSNCTGGIPPCGNEEFVEYNKTLEWTAREYLRKCLFKHGWAPDDNMTEVEGQNLYEGPARNAHRPIYMWYNEWPWFYHNNLTCWKPYPKFMCGHYTQVMWHNSSHIGTARRSYCYPKNLRIVLINTHYIYDGNYHLIKGFYPFKFGWPCSKCYDYSPFCHKNICVSARQCEVYNLDCECILDCKNCAKPDYKTCRCTKCKDGWDWSDCSYQCLNERAKDKRPCDYYPLQYCKMRNIYHTCHEHCLACRAISKASLEENLCCGGKQCDWNYILDENTCECIMACPSQICLHPPSTTTTPRTAIKATTKLPTKTVQIVFNKENNNEVEITKTNRQHKLPSSSSVTKFGIINTILLFIKLSLSFLYV